MTALLLAVASASCSGGADGRPSAAGSSTPTEAALPAHVAPTAPPTPRHYRALAIGFHAVCGVLEGGVVRCHGDGASFDVDTGGPVRAIALGQDRRRTYLHALREDGVVVRGAVLRRGTTATPIASLTNASAIATSGDGVCAVMAGAVRCWDPNASSEAPEVRLPAPAVSLAGDLQSGCRFAWGELTCRAVNSLVSCAQLVDGRAFCWPRSERRAREVPGLAGAQSIAIVNGARVWVDAQGLALHDRVESRVAPSAMTAPTGAVQVVGDLANACFRDAEGRVTCTGRRTPGATPETAPGGPPASVSEIQSATTLVHAFSTTCALAGGDAWCWGDNQGGRLGVPAPDSTHPATPIVGIADATALFAADATACVRRGTSTLSCWGVALAGFGDEPWATPTNLTLVDATELAGQTHGGVLITSSGALHGFGALSPRYYQPTDATPVVVDDEDGHTWAVGDVGRDGAAAVIEGIGESAVEVASTRQLACARTRDHALVCFHASDRTINGALVPTLSGVTRLIETGVTQVGTLGDGVCARVGADMRCFHVVRYVTPRGPALGVLRIEPFAFPFADPADAWGGNGRWQCGLFGTRARCVQEGREERGLDGITAFDVEGSGAVGESTLCGITTDRQVVCTALGGATLPNETVTGLTDVVGLALGTGFGCARRSNGTVSCWGRNGAGVIPAEGEHESLAVPTRLDAGLASGL